MAEKKKLVSLKKTFKINNDAFENGFWYDLPEGCSFKIRSFKSASVLTKNISLIEEYKIKKDSAPLTNDDFKEIAIETLCAAVIADWKNVADDEGNELTFSYETAKKLLSDEGMDALVDDLYNFSSNIENYRDANVQSIISELKKN